MKKLLIVITMCLVLLSGCANEDTMYLAPAGLTPKEDDLLTLLGRENSQYIYDFAPDDEVSTVDITVYRLKDREWEEINSSKRQFIDEKGRVALEFDNIGEKITIMLQSEHNSGRSVFESEKLSYRMNVTTSVLEGRTEIEYGKEIPLAVQIVTKKNMITSYNVDSFHTPREYAELDYEYVYAVTVKFGNE